MPWKECHVGSSRHASATLQGIRRCLEAWRRARTTRANAASVPANALIRPIATPTTAAPLPHDLTRHARRRWTKGEAQTIFACPLRDNVGHHAIWTVERIGL